MVALSVAMYSVTLAVIPLFTEKGMSFELAALGLGLLGAGQVVGRLLFLLVPRGTRPWLTVAIAAGLERRSSWLLALVPGPAWFLIGIGALAGAVRGAETLIQATAVADRWGTRNTARSTASSRCRSRSPRPSRRPSDRCSRRLPGSYAVMALHHGRSRAAGRRPGEDDLGVREERSPRGAPGCDP